MNILVFSWRDPKHPLAGGAEQVMHEHMKGWIEVGNSVTLFTSKNKTLPSEEYIDGVKIIRCGNQYFGVQIQGFLYYLKNRQQFDLVVDQFHGIPFFTPLYVSKPILAVIQEVAGKVWLKNDLQFPLNWMVGLVGYYCEPLVFLLYKKILFMTGSNSAKEDLLKVGIYSENIRVVPHGVIVLRKRHLPNKEKNKTVMFLGAITQDKGIEDVLKSFSLLNRLGKYNFWIVGKSSEKYLNLMDIMLNKYRIKSNTKYFGFVDIQTKFDLLAKAHVLINPSLLEGWGLVNIEANAMGTPVVAYNSPGLVDSVKDGFSGIIVKNNTPESLTQEINLLLSDKDRYNRMSINAKKWSDRFNWKKSRKISLGIINDLFNAS